MQKEPYKVFSGFLFKGKDKTKPVSPNWINDRPRQLGHKRTSTTNDIYTSILNDVKNDAMEKLGNMVFK